MKMDHAILDAIIRAKEQYNSYYRMGQITGGSSDKSLFYLYVKHYNEWVLGARRRQPQVGDDVWQRFWTILKQYLPREYAPLQLREETTGRVEQTGSRIYIFSQTIMDTVSLGQAQNPETITPNDRNRVETVPSGCVFGFESYNQGMEAYGLEDGFTVLCGPATRPASAFPCSLVACRYEERCLVRLLDRHGDTITLFATNAQPSLIQVPMTSIEWVAPVVEIRIDVIKMGLRKIVPRNFHEALVGGRLR